VVTEHSPAPEDQGKELLALYDRALPEVYGYLMSRCGSTVLAEDLTSEAFLAAVDAVWRDAVPQLSEAEVVDDWDVRLDAVRARAVLNDLGAHHRAVLTLRYLDGLPVADVASYLGRSEHATEALLVRAKGAFRRAYGERDDDAY
jgi:RNA polymerase sigma-70 factor (ECF subfamily)